MGSFNSAPKINNIDSQDDDVEMPNGLETAADLVNHCKLMRGDNRPELLQRSFFKPINDLSNDVTDGLRYLHLNSVSKGRENLFFVCVCVWWTLSKSISFRLLSNVSLYSFQFAAHQSHRQIMCEFFNGTFSLNVSMKNENWFSPTPPTTLWN